jgi:hypothetical protein
MDEYFLDKEKPLKAEKYIFEAFSIRQRLLTQNMM